MDSNQRQILRRLVDDDVNGLIRADKSYGDSWKRRGGVGAFMMLARKWDRIENRVSRPFTGDARNECQLQARWDIFEHIKDDLRPEGILDDIRDLRRYLLLVDAEMQPRPRQEVLPFGYEPDEDGRKAALMLIMLEELHVTDKEALDRTAVRIMEWLNE